MNLLLSLTGIFAAFASFGGSYLLYRGGKPKSNAETQHIYITSSDVVIENLNEEIVRQTNLIKDLNTRASKQDERIKLAEEAHRECDRKYSQVIDILSTHGISVPDEVR